MSQSIRCTHNDQGGEVSGAHQAVTQYCWVTGTYTIMGESSSKISGSFPKFPLVRLGFKYHKYIYSIIKKHPPELGRIFTINFFPPRHQVESQSSKSKSPTRYLCFKRWNEALSRHVCGSRWSPSP